MRYGESFTRKTLERTVLIRIEPDSRPVRLVFEPYQAVMLRVQRQTGQVEFIDIPYRPPVPETKVSA
jgi:hypothetical protein